MGLICFKCNKEILKEDKRIMIPIERPYLNLYMHRDCYNEIEEIVKYLNSNYERISKLCRKK